MRRTIGLLLAITAILGLGLLCPTSAGAGTQTFDGFTLQYLDADSGQVSAAATAVTAAMREIEGTLGIRLTYQIQVVLHRPADFQAIAPAIVTAQRSQAYYDPPRRTVHLVYGWTSARSTAEQLTDGVLRHELTHAYVHSNAAGVSIPRWFNEGLAMYVEMSRDERARQRQRVQQDAQRNILGTLDRSPYDIGVVAVMYLLDRFGTGTIESILMGMQRGTPFAGAFQTVTGVTPAAFEQAFRTAIR